MIMLDYIEKLIDLWLILPNLWGFKGFLFGHQILLIFVL
jgi:hypothetical protein